MPKCVPAKLVFWGPGTGRCRLVLRQHHLVPHYTNTLDTCFTTYMVSRLHAFYAFNNFHSYHAFNPCPRLPRLQSFPRFPHYVRSPRFPHQTRHSPLHTLAVPTALAGTPYRARAANDSGRRELQGHHHDRRRIRQVLRSPRIAALRSGKTSFRGYAQWD